MINCYYPLRGDELTLNPLTGTKAGALPKTVHMEDLWKSDFRAVSERPV